MLREHGENIWAAKVYRSNKLVFTAPLRGGGYSSKCAYDSALNVLRRAIGWNTDHQDILKVDRHLNRDLGMDAIEI